MNNETKAPVLTLEHLAPYLPYGLKVKTPKGLHTLKGIDTVFDAIGLSYWLDGKKEVSFSIDSKPILRPLSDLTKEIEHNGERFVPMVRLLELKERNQFSNDEMLRNCSANVKVKVISCETKHYPTMNMVVYEVKYLIETTNMGDLVYSFTYDEHFDRFSARDETRLMNLGVGHQKQLFQKLREWHIDVDKIIDQGLAIDINSIEGKETKGNG